MNSPSANDARDYETTLALIGRLEPAMPPAARSRAAWAVASAKLDLKAAIAAEGYSLHGAAPDVAEPKAAPAAPAPPTAAQAAELAQIRRDIHALRGGPPAPPAGAPFPSEHEHIDASAYPPTANRAMHNAAVALMKTDPTMSYREAVVRATRTA